MNFRGGLTTLILQNLAKDDRTTEYSIAQEIKQKSKGVLDFKEGTLYPALHGLENKELIESYARQENGRTRCYYRLTQKGKKTLRQGREEWLRFSEAFSLVLREA